MMRGGCLGFCSAGCRHNCKPNGHSTARRGLFHRLGMLVYTIMLRLWNTVNSSSFLPLVCCLLHLSSNPQVSRQHSMSITMHGAYDSVDSVESHHPLQQVKSQHLTRVRVARNGTQLIPCPYSSAALLIILFCMPLSGSRLAPASDSSSPSHLPACVAVTAPLLLYSCLCS